MKKVFSVLLVLTLIVGFTACGKTKAKTPDVPETPDPQKTPETPEAYTERIGLYETALSEGWNPGELEENGLCFMARDCMDAGGVGYAVRDLDGDGLPELLIGASEAVTDEFFGKLVLELWTVDSDGAVRKVFSSMNRDRYYYAGENLFANLASSSASESTDTTWRLAGGEFVDLGDVTAPEDYVQPELTDFAGKE